MSRFLRRAGLACALAFAATLGAAATDAAASPVSSGRNNWSCKPSAAHPNPVVVLHGFLGNADNDLGGSLGNVLKANGYCEFDLTYGTPIQGIPVGGITDVPASARTIARFIDKVLAATGAQKVAVVGHSEGGFIGSYLPKHVPGMAAKISHVIGIAPGNHGTSFAGAVYLADFANVRPQVDFVLKLFGCKACTQLITSAPLVKALNTGPIAQPGIAYTMIASRFDKLVTPHDTATSKETAFIREPGVTNLYTQDVCASSQVGHIGLAYDTVVFRLVMNALDPSTASMPVCGGGKMPF